MGDSGVTNGLYCKKCLLREMSDNAYAQIMQDYVQNLDTEIKALPEVYEQRLTVCKKCDLLADGLCRACGCFVEMRGAIKKNKCPYEKW